MKYVLIQKPGFKERCLENLDASTNLIKTSSLNDLYPQISEVFT